MQENLCHGAVTTMWCVRGVSQVITDTWQDTGDTISTDRQGSLVDRDTDIDNCITSPVEPSEGVTRCVEIPSLVMVLGTT